MRTECGLYKYRVIGSSLDSGHTKILEWKHLWIPWCGRRGEKNNDRMDR
jgi:hypothetical protein